jgi:hypothetical protein
LQPVVIGQTAAAFSNLLGIRPLGAGLLGIRIPVIRLPGMGLLSISRLVVSFFRIRILGIRGSE